jgi:CDP-diacylglycerol--serine O-phosphatidyltransferase
MKPQKLHIRKISILPIMFTLGNAVAGFAAILNISNENLVSAVWLIYLAILFDALDGTIARSTKSESYLGIQLDSLADMISFGVAPSFLAIKFSTLPKPAVPIKFLWLISAFYLVCAILRLAKYNVEHGPEKKTSQGTFSGLPSPAAAGVIGSSILFYLNSIESTFPKETDFAPHVIPIVTFLMAILMVSKIQYTHFFNKFIKKQHPFTILIQFILVGWLVAHWPELSAFLGFCIYLVSGPIYLLKRKLWGIKNEPKLVSSDSST